eukprot:TRINITY_DN3283_c0_g1_i1.p1 TRINITY_DN3283_c0_g1~~TRINITY_DN3283_c0_g1_i1.p1  ORF type:complete len:371 (-),score=96.35 TRINITY_DN3283_c0_g1_i1:86-1138(-)
MRGVSLKSFGEAENMEVKSDLNVPEMDSTHNLLIQVKAAGINRADVMQRKGGYPPPPGASSILGLEVAGVVEQVYNSNSTFKKGDKVMSLLSGGGYAEYVTISDKTAIPIPSNVSFEEAGGIPETFLTAYQALFWICQLSSSTQSVLIHAGASGVGVSAIQIIKSLYPNISIYVTASSNDKIEFCKSLGATNGVNYKQHNSQWLLPLQELLKEERDVKVDSSSSNKNLNLGVDIVVDFIGGSYLDQNIKILNQDGRMVVLSVLGGAISPEGLDLGAILRKRISIQGSTLRARNLEYKEKLTQEFVTRVLPNIENGKVKSVVHKVFDLDEVVEAHKMIEKNENIGKIVLKF